MEASGGRMPKRSGHAVSEGQDVPSERPPRGHVQTRAGALLVEPAYVASFRRSSATTGAGTNRKSAASSASGVICLSSDDEMCE